MEQHQLATLALMQIFILPAAYFVWALGAATWTTFASNRQYADVTRARRDGEVFAHGRFWFIVVWIGLNAALLALVG